MIYFIQQGNDGPVKIGRSGDPLKRLLELQTSSDETLFLRGTMPGDRVMEKRLHNKFREFHLRGEWFRPVEAIMEIAWYGGFLPDPGQRPSLTQVVLSPWQVCSLCEATQKVADENCHRVDLGGFGWTESLVKKASGE